MLESEEGVDGTISIHPELPGTAEASHLGAPGGSAFLHLIGLVGTGQMQIFQAAVQQMRHFAKEDWGKLSRLTTYYLNRDWVHFDPAASALIGQDVSHWPEEWKKHDIVHRLYDLFLGPLVALDPARSYPEMKVAFNTLWNPEHPNFEPLLAFARAESASGHFRNVQRDLFASLGRYTQLMNGLMPGVICNLVPEERQPEVDTLRLFRDEYEMLRDFYIQSFETCHKSLRWVVGTVNAQSHGDPDRFTPLSTIQASVARRTPRSLDEFAGLVSAIKRGWLPLVPTWDRLWDRLFDRHLRNDIGHASARHELATGKILRDHRQAVAYTRFVQRTQALVHGILACANAMKILSVYAEVQPTDQNSGLTSS